MKTIGSMTDRATDNRVQNELLQRRSSERHDGDKVFRKRFQPFANYNSILLHILGGFM